jgi:hypothetical protein
MHDAVVPGPVRDVVRLLDGERVHVRADRHRGSGSVGDLAQAPRDPDSRPDFVAQLPQPIGDEGRRPALPEGELGVRVDVAAYPGQLRRQHGRPGKKIHAFDLESF